MAEETSLSIKTLKFNRVTLTPRKESTCTMHARGAKVVAQRRWCNNILIEFIAITNEEGKMICCYRIGLVYMQIGQLGSEDGSNVTIVKGNKTRADGASIALLLLGTTVRGSLSIKHYRVNLEGMTI